jgi:hypothetical protein
MGYETAVEMNTRPRLHGRRTGEVRDECGGDNAHDQIETAETERQEEEE